jgi:hypothetical protein
VPVQSTNNNYYCPQNKREKIEIKDASRNESGGGGGERRAITCTIYKKKEIIINKICAKKFAIKGDF